MIQTDERALYCDMVETYHVLDYKGLPPVRAAALAVGLGRNSRIMMKTAGTRVPMELYIQAAILDCVRMLIWAQTKDGQHGRNRPRSVVSALTETKPQKVTAFDSVEAFRAAMRQFEGKEGERGD